MFDFELLEVYKSAKAYNLSIHNFLVKHDEIYYSIQNQLRRAALSIMLNIAEGTGKRTGPDKRNYYSIARGSVFENVAILDLLSELSILSKNDFDLYYEKLEEISKMLYAMIKAIK